MYSLGVSVQWFSVVLQGCILVLMARRRLYRQFPVFTSYVTYVMLQMMLRSAFLSNAHVYFYVYWFTAPIEVILTILAAHESFARVFGSFYLVWWFRFLFPGAIVMALGYSAWQAYAHPPIVVSRGGAAIISAAVASQYVIMGICALFFILIRFVHVRWRVREYRLMLGFCIASLMVAFGGAVRSEFGTRFRFASEMLPGVAYLGAVVIWLSAVLVRESAAEGSVKGRPSLEELLGQLREQLRLVGALLGRDVNR